MIPDHPERRPRNVRLRWHRRFGDAVDGLRQAARDQESLWVHACVSAAVVALGILLEIELWRWCVLLLCIAMVISLELMNSAIERLVKALHPEHDAGLAAALHMAAGSVLTAALGAIVIGIIVFVPPIVRLW